MWLRGSQLPSYIIEYSKKLYIDGETSAPLIHLLALVGLARGAELGILRVRKEHATSPDSADPETVAQNILFLLRCGRDELLKQIPSAHIGMASARLDRLIETTRVLLDAYMSEPVDRILSHRRLLPGPWIDAARKTRVAYEEAHRLVVFLEEPREGVLRKRGARPKYSPQADRELVEGWKHAKESGLTMAEFCEDRSMDKNDFKNAQSRERYRGLDAQ
ncbi:hypothetical protein JYU07_00745 [Roseiflexus sp. AH-315-K22]|nr:hypothetical protein [Roseiflexus sp. AH-315-K22]